MDALTVTNCFSDGNCEYLFFFLIEATNASFFLLQNSGIDTTQWQNFDDVLDTYYEKCPNGIHGLVFLFSTHQVLIVSVLSEN